jgi:hypothetical protein
MKNIGMLTILTLSLIPINGLTQISFSNLPENKTSIGALYSQQKVGVCFDDGTDCVLLNIKQITGGFDYRLVKNSKISFYPSLTFGKMDFEDEHLDFPPSPALYIRVSNIYDIDTNSLGVFYIGEIGASYLQMVYNFDFNDTIHLIAPSVGGGIGIYKKFRNKNSEWVITPSFSLYYHNVWHAIGQYSVEKAGFYSVEDIYTIKLLSGQVEVEIEISPGVSIIGLSTFSFQGSGSIFTIGVNFH